MERNEFTPEVIKEIEDRKITTALLKDGTIARIFMSTGGTLCQFRARSSRRGFRMDIENIVELRKAKEKTELDADLKTFKMLQKFRKEALKATFTNDFIRSCIALPETMEKWVADGKKSPYEYSITTGCKITGDLISVEAVTKKMPSYYREALKEAIANKTEFKSGTFPFQGYDGSVSLERGENGEIRGFLSKEYKNCGNGYYYLLINDKYFIGYDVD